MEDQELVIVEIDVKPRATYQKPVLSSLGEITVLTTGGSGPSGENTDPEVGPSEPDRRP